MGRYLIRRILQFIPVFFGATFLIFALVFIMPTISLVYGRSTIGLFVDLSYPILGKPGFAGMIEYVCIGTARLIGITHIPATVAKDKIFGFCLFKGMVQFVG